MPKRNPSTDRAIQQLWADLPLSESEHQNDASNAERFVRMNGGIVRYCAKLRRWLVCNDTHLGREDRRVIDTRELLQRFIDKSTLAEVLA